MSDRDLIRTIFPGLPAPASAAPPSGTDDNDVFDLEPGSLGPADRLDGGRGTDTVRLLNAGTLDLMCLVSIEKILGSSGDDIFFLSLRPQEIAEIDGGTGQNIVRMSGGARALDLSLVTLRNIAAIEGSDLADTIVGSRSKDLIRGGQGNDRYFIDAEDSVFEAAGGGTDEINVAGSYRLGDNVENLVLTGDADVDGTGNALDNEIRGSTGDNILRGLAGNDTLDGGAFNGSDSDILIGGRGNDTYIVAMAEDIIDERSDDGDGIDTVISSVSFDLRSPGVLGDVENLILAGERNYMGFGNRLDNRITGNPGQNDLSGFDGNDRLDGGAGGDRLFGGRGDDTYVADGDDILSEAEGGGIDTVETAEADYTLDPARNGQLVGAFENLVFTGGQSHNGSGNGLDNRLTGAGGADILSGADGNDILSGLDGNDTLSGGAGQDRLEGGAGADRLSGNAGNDRLDGGLGEDILNGGDGNDTYVVDSGGDVVDESEGFGTDTVESAVSFSLIDTAHAKGAIENLTLVGSLPLTARGNALSNGLTGNAGANRLYGGGGNDTLDGRGGADLMVGGKGRDAYVVDNAGDVVDEKQDQSPGLHETDVVKAFIPVDLADAARFLGEVENVVLAGNAALSASGNALANLLQGNAGANRLDGRAGDDVLSGGAGADSLTGGAGRDSFRFDTAPDGRTNIDRITDFSVVDDRLELENAIFTRLKTPGTLSKAFFAANATGTALDRDDYLLYNTKTGALLYDPDGTGSTRPLEFARLKPALALTHADFWVT